MECWAAAPGWVVSWRTEPILQLARVRRRADDLGPSIVDTISRAQSIHSARAWAATANKNGHPASQSDRGQQREAPFAITGAGASVYEMELTGIEPVTPCLQSTEDAPANTYRR